MRLTRIGPVSVAKVSFVVYAAMGLFFGAIFSLASLVGAVFGAAARDESAAVGAIFGVGAIIFFPLMYGVFGALGGLVMAWLYNLVAGVVGGVEVTLDAAPGAR